MYQELEQFLKSEHFDDDLKEVLTTSYPTYLQIWNQEGKISRDPIMG